MAHGFREGDGTRRRSFRCTACDLRFTPGAAPRGADPALRTAVRRVHDETGVSYRLLARALTRHLGVSTSHVTVGAWCRETERGAEPEGAPCEYLSLLWALRQELTEAEGTP
ncbi:MAG: hypothetical protein KY455_01545 [Euryarchaeota archaeon]|nr:hypothetical protein [Euryarchaeota archaeon]